MNAHLASAAAALLIDSRCELGECVLWCERNDVLWWTDILSRRLWRHVPATGATVSWELPAALACFAFCEDGRLLLGLAKGLFLCDPDRAREGSLPLQHVADVEPSRADTRINDGRSDRHGNFVFGTKRDTGDGAPGSFYQYSAAHGLRRLALPGACIPNSICFSLDGRTLYFCDSLTPELLCCDYEPERAEVANIRVFARIDLAGASPDGSVIDADGCLWNAQWGASRVVSYRPDGRMDRIVQVPVANPSCCAFGGVDFDRLYISTARENMDAAALARMPHAGGIYLAPLPDARGVPESRVRAMP